MHKFILNVRIHKIVDNPLNLIDINVCHYSKQPHCCHIGYACAGACHDAFVFCNITIPCHIWCASTMSTRTCSLIARIVNFLVTISSALGSGHYLADPTIKMSNIFLCSPELLATIDFEVQLKSIFIAVSQVGRSLRKYGFPYSPLRFTPPLIFPITEIFGTIVATFLVGYPTHCCIFRLHVLKLPKIINRYKQLICKFCATNPQ